MLMAVKIIKKGIKMMSYGLILLVCGSYIALYFNGTNSTSEMHKVIKLFNDLAQSILDTLLNFTNALKK